ncbi:MAG: undecaprenyldiphospho-muramoylpentapeptide beta-N-acetylglucosaminyltransferase [Lentisphaerae bacterium]|nr:undecaprenyldiphospho-muramoylpentapeptide beta-N-acetylglucosaminyltransferase [Lentisphaerota bacterium]
MRVGIACGGTGGHIFPGLATAEALMERGHEVTLWLVGKAIESSRIAGWDGPVQLVQAEGLSASGLKRLGAVFEMGRAVWQCRRIMSRNRPDIMLGMGSYASVAPILAARSFGVPSVLHEANAVPGRAVSFLSGSAKAVAVSFESAKNYIKHRDVVVTGFPIRREVLNRSAERLLPSDVFTILVTGGSQGAHFLNELVSTAVCRLQEAGLELQVVHLAGRQDEDMVRRRYDKQGITSVVYGFCSEMARAYVSADFVIARAGASTCAEISAFAVPALLIPLPTAIRNHQVANANEMVAKGGVDMMEQDDLSVNKLVEYLHCRMHDSKLLADMKNAFAHVGQSRDAANELVSLLERVCDQ